MERLALCFLPSALPAQMPISQKRNYFSEPDFAMDTLLLMRQNLLWSTSRLLLNDFVLAHLVLLNNPSLF